MFTKNAVGVIDRLRVKAESNGDGTVGFDFITIITAVTTLLPLLQGLFANCNKKPPAPTPIPPALSAMGVSTETWNQASDAKWIATDAWNGNKYRQNVVNAASKKLMAEQRISKKAAKPLAIASLDTSRTELLEDLASTIHGSKISNS